METTILPSLRRFAAWVTGLTDSYRFNPFVRSTVSIVALQVVLAAITIGVFWWALNYAQGSLIAAITAHIDMALHGSTTSLATLPQSIDAVRAHTLEYIFMGLAVLTAIFSFLIARFSLRPARNSLQFQKRFISNLAHEIRTPLAVIKTTTEVTLLDPNLAPEFVSALTRTITELDRISETINNLLSLDTLLRPERMKSTLVDLSDLVETVTKQYEPVAKARAIALDVHVEHELCVHGNASALDQVVTNLLKNALTFTPEHRNGSVKVSLGLEDGKVVLGVVDTGIGIKHSDLEHIFEPFYRGDTSRTRGTGTGTSGLGLAIVNEIVRLHHGTIRIRSVVSQGTSIHVLFPHAQRQPEPAPSETILENSHQTVGNFS